MTFSRPSTPSISLSSCGHDRGLDVGGHAGAAGAEDRVHLVEEHDHRGAVGGLLPGPLEDQPDVPLGLADVLVEQLRALDVQEVAGVRLLPARRRDLLGQRVRHGLGDQRLAAAGRAVEQHALGRPQLVLAEQVGVQERQFDGVADLFDLPGQAADVLVGDVRHLLQHEVLDLGLRHPLVGVAGLGVDQQGVARLERGVQQRRGELHHPLLVGVPDDQRAIAAEHLAQRADLAEHARRSPASTTVSASLRRTCWPRCSVSTSTVGDTATRIRRPPVNTSTVSSGPAVRKTPYPLGGWASRSTSSWSCRSWARASWRVTMSFSLRSDSALMRLADSVSCRSSGRCPWALSPAGAVAALSRR